MKRVILYTDGACSGNPGVGGWGALMMFNGHEKRISSAEQSTTNNRMEVTAVIEGLKCLKEPCEVQVYSDSAYTVNAFNNAPVALLSCPAPCPGLLPSCFGVCARAVFQDRPLSRQPAGVTSPVLLSAG